MKYGDLISVIVPIYNAEEYLSKCLDSILNQIYSNLEIILIDDGSIDSSGNICDEYAKENSRIRVIHKRNEGLMKARKDGVLLARGEVIAFVDADDWIEPKMYDELIEILARTGCDIVSSGIIRDYKEKETSKIVYDNYNEGMYNNMDEDIYPTMLWNFQIDTLGIIHNLVTKLYKKAILQKVLFNISTDIFYGEDCLICFAYCLNAKKIYVLHQAYYHYNIHENSMCSTADEKLLVNTYHLYKELKGLFEQYDNSMILIRQLKRYILEIDKHNLKQLFDIDLGMDAEWEFEYEMSLFDSEYIIYGAGSCGQAMYRMLKNKGKEKNMVAWVDKKIRNIEEYSHGIIPPSELKKLEYKYVIVAVQDKQVADSIKAELTGYYGVEISQVIWKRAKRKYYL